MSRSGLCAQFGMKAESTAGTPVTVDRFLPVNSFEPELDKQEAVSEAVRGCSTTPMDDETAVVGRSVSGSLNLEVRSKSFGPLWGQIVGATPTPVQIGATSFWRQIHLPGSLTNKSMTWQGGFAESYSDTVRALTYKGVKITNGELSIQRGGKLMLGCEFDAWDEDTGTALANDTYATGWEIFTFAGFAATIGGTPATAAGRTTISGGATIKGLRAAKLAFAHGLATDRFFAGGSGIKSEQTENAMREYTGELDTEFADRTQLYDVFAAHTTTALQFTFTGAVAIGGNFPVLRLTYPKCKLLTGTPKLGGPGIINGPVKWRAYGDSTGTHPDMQLEYESTDTAL